MEDTDKAGRRKDCFGGGQALSLALVIHRAGLNSPWRGLATDVCPPRDSAVTELSCAERIAGARRTQLAVMGELTEG